MEQRMAQPPSNVDAMGRDKRRQVAGGTYGPTRTRIAVRFAIFLAIVIVLVVAAKIAVDELDKAPDTISNEAPWAQPDAPQRHPRPLE
jgi:hypothetical protein